MKREKSKARNVCIWTALTMMTCSCSKPPTHTTSYYNAEDEVKITIELYHSHPFLAEYDRKVLFGSREIIFDARDLPPDTGGYAAANLYRCGQGSYFLDGYATSESIAVAGAGKNNADCLSTKNYLGVFEGAGTLPWRFCQANECPEKKLEMRGG